MKAIVIDGPGAPEVLKIREIPRPVPAPGWVLIKVMAFGLNRAELFTRQGHSPGVVYPRVLGIECVGLVEEAPSGSFPPGQKVAAIMGGMGRLFDGGYAEYTCVPADCVFPIESELEWPVLGAIPEMFQTVWGSLHAALEVQPGQTLLIRGGTSSIGMTAAQLAKRHGLRVLATTRNPAKGELLTANGADEVVIDTGEIAEAVRRVVPGGVERVLELVGTATLVDSMKCAAPKGVVCMTGILGNEWVMRDFEPFVMVPSTVKFTTYGGGAGDMDRNALREFIAEVASGRARVNLDRVFPFDRIVEAHHYMEENRATGKLVVLGP